MQYLLPQTIERSLHVHYPQTEADTEHVRTGRQ